MIVRLLCGNNCCSVDGWKTRAGRWCPIFHEREGSLVNHDWNRLAISRGGTLSKVRAEQVSPGHDACERPIRGDDREAGHAMLKQQSRRNLDGRVGCDRD